MRKATFLLAGLLILIVACSGKKIENQTKKLVFIVTKKQDNIASKSEVYLDLTSVTNRLGQVNTRQLQLIDLNNNKPVRFQWINPKGTGVPMGISFTINFERNEGIRTFCLNTSHDQPTEEISNVKTIPASADITITYLTNAGTYLALKGEPAEWSALVANSILDTYPDPKDLEYFSPGKWSYTNGFFLNALSEIYTRDKNPRYLNYIRNWVALFINDKGQLDPARYERNIFELDNITPGHLLIFLNQLTRNKRYRITADELIDQLNHQPRTSDGGFWHKKVYTNQMWLDGIYMADVFLAHYGSTYNQPQYIDEAVKQMEIIYKHTYDPNTGLLFHGWDESKNKTWANQETGASSTIWGRALGWYLMALADALDYIPANHAERPAILKIFRDVSSSLAKFQDKTGMWYQVVDKADNPGNWPESSCTAMFGYAYAKGYAKGYLPVEYLEKAKNAFEGLKNNEIFFDDEGRFYLNGTVKVGTLNVKVSKGDFNYYVGVDQRINDFKGVAAFMYLAIALEDIKKTGN